MRTSKFTPEQIVVICRQGESGVPVVELCRQHGISEQTYYRWKKKLGDISTRQLKELHQLREDNRKLKQLVADLTLDNTILKEVLGKKWQSPSDGGRSSPGVGSRIDPISDEPARQSRPHRSSAARARPADGLTPPPPRDRRGA
jgi:putative transposase